MADRGFDELVSEADGAPIVGWDFSWLEGRATEERPSWGYSNLAVQRVRAGAGAVLDIQTGSGEVFESILQRAGRAPGMVAATEGWAPNLELARTRLGPFGVNVTDAGEGGRLPFSDGSFDLVLSRHPNRWDWTEIARVLAPGGTYLAQHIGPGSHRALTEFLLGPVEVSDARSATRARAGATATGLDVRDLREESLRVEFFDVGAVVYFLRMVIWTVPDFEVARFRDRLAALHEQIRVQGPFVSYTNRQLIEAVRPVGVRPPRRRSRRRARRRPAGETVMCARGTGARRSQAATVSRAR